jgi:DNA-binding response OmpR family regulator
MNILFIEDEPEACDAVKRLLSRVGFVCCKFRCIGNLHDGINEMILDRPDLILLDLNLTDCRGMDTVQKIPDLDRHAPVVVVSGMEAEQYRSPCIRAGAMNFLYKSTYLAPGVEAFFVNAIIVARGVWKRIQNAPERV